MAGEATRVAAHLVLSGGGVLCLSYAGALCVLHEHGIEFESVSSCSAGTFIGALLCSGLSPPEIEKEIQRVSPPTLAGEPVFPSFLSLLRWPFARYRSSGFPAVFRQILGGRDPTFVELQIPLTIAGIDIAFKRFLVYASHTHPDMRVSEALKISVSYPFAYPPHEPEGEGRIILDAGIASECPVWLAADRDDDLPIIALRPAKPAEATRPKSIEVYFSEVFGSAVRCLDDYIIKQIPRVRLIEIDCGGIRNSEFNLSASQKRFLIEAGRKASQDALHVFGNDLRNIHEVSRPILTRGTPHDIAQASADRKMTRFNQELSELVRDRVFISYSHRDKPWLDRLRTHLTPYFPNSPLEIWDDTQISSGEEWRKKIEHALAGSKVAVLLVTPHFLASRFIMEEELPSMLEAAKRERLKILWVHVSPCAWDQGPLKEIQAANEISRPLEKLEAAERNEALVEISKKVKQAMK